MKGGYQKNIINRWKLLFGIKILIRTSNDVVQFSSQEE